jgi:hypothetical protein
MVKYFISINKDNVIQYGKTKFDGVVSSNIITYETFNNETDWKKQLTHYQNKYPQDILEDDINYPLELSEDMFPYPNRNIRIFLTYQQITNIIESPYKTLIDLALLAPYQKNDRGIIIWLEYLNNPHMSASQVKQILEIFNAELSFKYESEIHNILSMPAG